MVEEESDDTEAVVKLLELNDAINTTIQRYRLVKKGDLAGASALPTMEAIASGSAKPPPPIEGSLIDLLDDDPNDSKAPQQASTSTNSLQEDLLGLSIDDPNGSIGPGGGIALGFGANQSWFTSTTMYEFSSNCVSRYSRASSSLLYNPRQFFQSATRICFSVSQARPFCNFW